MKKFAVLFTALTLPLLLFTLTSCKRSYDYAAHLSEVRSDLFLCHAEEFDFTLACLSREYPYAQDGIACPRTDTVEIEVKFKEQVQSATVTVLGEAEYGGELSYRNTKDDWYYSVGVSKFPEGQISVRIRWEDSEREIAATSVKTEHTLTPEAALDCAVKAEQNTIEALTVNKQFFGEFRVRLLRRDKNYYYVGIVATDGHTVSLLLDAESGNVLARRESA